MLKTPQMNPMLQLKSKTNPKQGNVFLDGFIISFMYFIKMFCFSNIIQVDGNDSDLSDTSSDNESNNGDSEDEMETDSESKVSLKISNFEEMALIC